MIYPMQNSSQGAIRDIVANKSGFGSHDTFSKAKYISENAPEEMIKQLDDGKLSINKAYITLKEEKRKLEEENKQLKELYYQEKDKKVEVQEKIVVSGHQRVRACKELRINQIPCRVHIYDDDEKVLKDLIETNIRQRGMGNPNPVKFGRCIVELERLYGIRQGSAGKRSLDTDNSGLKSQSDLANDLEINQDTLNNYKKLTTLIPELQDLIQDKQLSATTGYKVWAKMSEEEQEKFFNEIGKDKISEIQKYENIKFIFKEM